MSECQMHYKNNNLQYLIFVSLGNPIIVAIILVPKSLP